MNDITVDIAIEKLQQIKRDSKLGGDTVVCLCLVNSGIEDVGIDDIKLVSDHVGAVAYVMVKHPAVQGE